MHKNSELQQINQAPKIPQWVSPNNTVCIHMEQIDKYQYMYQ